MKIFDFSLRKSFKQRGTAATTKKCYPPPGFDVKALMADTIANLHTLRQYENPFLIVSRSFSNIATRWAAGEGSPPEWSRNQAAFVLGQLTQVTEPQVEPRPQKRIQINRQLRPLFLYGHLTPLSRTLVSTRESIPFRVPPSSQYVQGGSPASPGHVLPSSTDADST